MYYTSIGITSKRERRSSLSEGCKTLSYPTVNKKQSTKEKSSTTHPTQEKVMESNN